VQGHPVSSGGFGSGDLERELKKSDSIARLLQDKKGTAIINLLSRLLERKTAITSSDVGAATSGVLQIDRIPGIVPEARQVLRVRDLLTARPTALQVIDFVKVSTPMANASPQAEGSDKFENAVAFTTASQQVKTIATWIPATKQVLDDFQELLSFIQGSLGYYVAAAEEIQMQSGDNTGNNLNGLIPQATSFDLGLLTGGWNYIDIIGRACQQIAAAKETQPTFVVLNPADWWTIRLTKDDYGRYVLGDPTEPVNVQALFGLIPDPTTNIAPGTFRFPGRRRDPRQAGNHCGDIHPARRLLHTEQGRGESGEASGADLQASRGVHNGVFLAEPRVIQRHRLAGSRA
jgi:HK97 family phage major capsid protein